MLQLTWPSVAALLRGHAAEHQSLCRHWWPPVGQSRTGGAAGVAAGRPSWPGDPGPSEGRAPTRAVQRGSDSLRMPGAVFSECHSDPRSMAVCPLAPSGSRTEASLLVGGPYRGASPLVSDWCHRRSGPLSAWTVDAMVLQVVPGAVAADGHVLQRQTCTLPERCLVRCAQGSGCCELDTPQMETRRRVTELTRLFEKAFGHSQRAARVRGV
jgi:hypothetical protein